MNKLLVFPLVLSMIANSSLAIAEEKTQPAPAVVVPVKKGQIAPYDGVILTVTAAASITVELNSIQEKIRLAVDRTSEEASVRCDAKVSESEIKAESDRKVLQAKLDAQLQERKVIVERLKKAEEDKPNVAVWIGVGFIGGIAATAGIVALTK